MNTGELGLVFGHATHVGQVREVNEDSYLVLAPPSYGNDLVDIKACLVVADGVGGNNGGEVASGVLVELFWRWFADGRFQDMVYYNPTHRDYYVAVLKDLLETANEQLYQLAYSQTHLANMGTTATAVILSNGRLFWGHVGDTRAYLIREGSMQRLTTDHSWVNDEVAAGRLTYAEAQNHPRRHVINRVLGVSSMVRIDRDFLSIQTNDIIVIASDGLTGLVTDEEIVHVIHNSGHPQLACDQLVSWANHRGGTDNITVVIVKIDANENDGLPNGVAASSVYLGYPIKVQSLLAPSGQDLETLSVNGLPGNKIKRTEGLTLLIKQESTFWLTVLLMSSLSVLLGLAAAGLVLVAPLIEVNYPPLWPLQSWQLTGILTAVFVALGYMIGQLYTR